VQLTKSTQRYPTDDLKFHLQTVSKHHHQKFL